MNYTMKSEKYSIFRCGFIHCLSAGLCQHRGLVVDYRDMGERTIQASRADCIDPWSLDQNSVRYMVVY